MGVQAKEASPFFCPPRKGPLDAGWCTRLEVMQIPATNEPLLLSREPRPPSRPGTVPLLSPFKTDPP